MLIVSNNNKIVDDMTGEIITEDFSPKFPNWDYDRYYNSFPTIRFLEPQTAYEADKENIPQENTIAEEKFDGHRSLMFITPEGNRLFSRRVSKKTGWYAENTDQVPHLRDARIPKDFYGTVIDGELVMPTFSDVQSVTGALPATAINNQKEKGFARFNVFDILYYKGINVQNMPLWKRKIYLAKVTEAFDSDSIIYTPFYCTNEVYSKLLKLFFKYEGEKALKLLNKVCTAIPSFKALLEKCWEEGKEGLIVKDIDAPYEQKRTRNYLKLKDMIYRDVVIMGYKEPTKDFDGKTDLHDWMYWEDRSQIVLQKGYGYTVGIKNPTVKPVTKPYAMGYIGALTCGVYRDGKLFEVVEAKGLTDEQLEYIKTHKKELLGTVIEVKAQAFSDKSIGSLRHPRFSRYRPDKNAESCTWEDYVC
jgi:ATP-dependent DNA ligase